MNTDTQKTVKDLVYLLAFLAAAVGFAHAGNETLAGACVGAASSYAIPESIRSRVPPAAMAVIGAIVLSSTLSGCTASGGLDWNIVKRIVQTSCTVAGAVLPSSGDERPVYTDDESEEEESEQ